MDNARPRKSLLQIYVSHDCDLQLNAAVLLELNKWLLLHFRRLMLNRHQKAKWGADLSDALRDMRGLDNDRVYLHASQCHQLWNQVLVVYGMKRAETPTAHITPQATVPYAQRFNLCKPRRL